MIERLRALGAALRSQVDSAWLAAFRVLFGLTLLTSTLRFLAYGWIDQLFVAPQFHFKYWGFSWVKVPPSAELHALFWLLSALCVLVSLGLLFRAAAFGLFVGFTYLQLLDVATYLNHYYLASLLALLLACSPAGRTWSLGRALAAHERAQHRAYGVAVPVPLSGGDRVHLRRLGQGARRLAVSC